jgi:hypothetical protein
MSSIAGVVFAVSTLVLCNTNFPAHWNTLKLSWRPLVTCWLLLLATIGIALQIKWTQLALVTQRHDSPSDFIKEHVNSWIYVMLNVL